MDVIGEETLKRMDTVGFYNDLIFDMAKKYMNGDILEAGSGIGSFTKKLSHQGEVTAIDIQKHYVSKMKRELKHVAQVGLGDIEKGKYFFGDKKRFDSIICLNVLEHIADDKAALRNMYKLLRKNGHIFLLTPAHSQFYGSLDKNLGHERRYSLNKLAALFEQCGYKVQKKYYFNVLGGLGWLLNSRVLRRKIIPSNQLKMFSVVARLPLFIEKLIKPPFGLSCVIVASK